MNLTEADFKQPRLRKKQWQRIVVCLLLLLSALYSYASREYPELLTPLTARQPGMLEVVAVEDGDTITVRTPQGEERVRLIGVDTPEKNHPSKPVQCFAEAASEFTTSLIGEHDVRLEADPNEDNRDKYGRLLRYVYLPDGTFVNEQIIMEGYGFAYTVFDFAYEEQFKTREAEARAQGRGLWYSCQVTENELSSETNPL